LSSIECCEVGGHAAELNVPSARRGRPLMSATGTAMARQTVGELRKECERLGLSVQGCIERADLEALLAGTRGRPAAAAAAASTASQAQPQRPSPSGKGKPTFAEMKAELETWVAYGPRALVLLEALERTVITLEILRETGLGKTVRRYAAHSDGTVRTLSARLITAWKGLLPGAPISSTSSRRRPAPTRTREVRRGRVAVDDDDSDNDASASSSSSSSNAVAMPGAGPAPCSDDDAEKCVREERAHVEQTCGWQETSQAHAFRGRKERFHVFHLKHPFASAKWTIRVRVTDTLHKPEVRELLDRMAADFGAIFTTDQVREADRQVLNRLQRLEERFRGNGVTEGEARNAMRLFERELSKANWTQDKFLKLKRQIAGTEEWSTADAVAESALLWNEEGKRRQAWFADASERIAAPLGLEFGYSSNGGCCFAGPLSAAVGAALTTALVCHLGYLDLGRALNSPGRSKISTPQFLQGFVDGALDRDRHLVWAKLFSLEDEHEAARFCEETLHTGFFDEDRGTRQPGQGEEEEQEEDLQSMLRNLFSASRGMDPAEVRPTGGPSRPARSSGSDGAPSPAGPPASVAPPGSYTPFSGKGQRLEEEPASGSVGERGNGNSWALTFTSNLELARCSRKRSRQMAKKCYHWTFSGQAVKPTQTGTQSYSQGKQAGAKRKGEIDGVAGSAKKKFQKGQRLAITQ